MGWSSKLSPQGDRPFLQTTPSHPACHGSLATPPQLAGKRSQPYPPFTSGLLTDVPRKGGLEGAWVDGGAGKEN